MKRLEAEVIKEDTSNIFALSQWQYVVCYCYYWPGSCIFVYRMEFDKTKLSCSWNRDQNCIQNSTKLTFMSF